MNNGLVSSPVSMSFKTCSDTTCCAILSLQLLLEKWLKLEEWIENLNTPPFVADEICIYILSRILGFGIAIILRNCIWTTTDVMT